MARPDYLRPVNEDYESRPIEKPLKSGDGGGTFDGMEARVARLEANVEHLQTDVKELRSDMKDALARLVKIESVMATKGFVFSVYGIVSVLLAAIILFQAQIQQLIGVLPPSP